MTEQQAIWLQGVLTAHRFLIVSLMTGSAWGHAAPLERIDAASERLRKALALRLRVPEGRDPEQDELAVQTAALSELETILRDVRTTVASGPKQ